MNRTNRRKRNNKKKTRRNSPLFDRKTISDLVGLGAILLKTIAPEIYNDIRKIVLVSIAFPPFRYRQLTGQQPRLLIAACNCERCFAERYLLNKYGYVLNIYQWYSSENDTYLLGLKRFSARKYFENK